MSVVTVQTVTYDYFTSESALISTQTVLSTYISLATGTGSMATGSMGTGSMATGSMATGSMGTGSMGTGSMATGSMATGIEEKLRVRVWLIHCSYFEGTVRCG
jgi:hypothetical protein